MFHPSPNGGHFIGAVRMFLVAMLATVGSVCGVNKCIDLFLLLMEFSSSPKRRTRNLYKTSFGWGVFHGFIPTRFRHNGIITDV